MKLSHIDKDGSMRMVDVSEKKPQKRIAVAVGTISMAGETLRLLKAGTLKKGDALACARVAGIMAAKKTSELIPLCHNLSIDTIDVDFLIRKSDVEIRAKAVCKARTGVEMEALTAVSVAALTIYDMCKAVDKNMVIGKIRLIEKQKEDTK
jgi:cyclic pyranopterin phosphate synthase